MLKNKNTANKFVAQYFKEVVSKSTIDSFRPRYTNAHVVLEEIKFVCENIETGTTKYSYLKNLIFEAQEQLNKDIVLNKKHERKKKIILKHLSSLKNGDKDVLYLKQCLNIEMSYFKNNYVNEIIEELSSYCDKRKNANTSNNSKDKIIEDNLRRLINSFVSECLYMGVSLVYLRKQCMYKQNISKTELKAELNKIIKQKRFNVYLVLQNIDKEILKLILKIFRKNKFKINVQNKWPIIAGYVPKSLEIKPERKDDTLIFSNIKVSAKDENGALLEFRFLLDSFINFIHINYLNRNIKFFREGLIYSYSKQEYKKVEYEGIVRYKYKPNFDDFLTKLQNYSNLKDGIRNQIHKSVYYLDASLNEYNVINKYLNSWIAIEVLFNNLSKEDVTENNLDKGTIKYIYEYIPIISTVFYMRKIFKYLAIRIKDNLKDSSLVKEFIIKENIDLGLFVNFLSDEKKYDQMKKELECFPELTNKIDYFVTVLYDPEKLKCILVKHETNIKIHLERLYRIRNHIIHSGEGLILKNKLFNLTSISMLTINNQEYAIDVINKVSLFTSVKKYKKDVRLIDILQSYKVINDTIKFSLQDNKNGKNSKEDVIKFLMPTEFISGSS